MPPESPDRLAYVVFCDQSRNEPNGKLLLIGVYGTALLIEGHFPAFISSLTLVACIRSIKAKEHVKATINLPGYADAITHESDIEAKYRDDTCTWAIMISPCVLKAAGEVRFELEFEDGSRESASLDVMTAAERKNRSW